ncbi:hypothetical protein HN51_036261, partial [Arachis hypogaea]
RPVVRALLVSELDGENQRRAMISVSFVMSFFRSLSYRFAHNPSSSHTKSSVLSEKVTRPDELSPKHNIFKEEVFFKDINQAIDNWEIPNIPQDELYVPEETKRTSRSDYIIKIAENNIPLGPESGEKFHLLNKQFIQEHVCKYKYLHIGC